MRIHESLRLCTLSCTPLLSFPPRPLLYACTQGLQGIQVPEDTPHTGKYNAKKKKTPAIVLTPEEMFGTPGESKDEGPKIVTHPSVILGLEVPIRIK